MPDAPLPSRPSNVDDATVERVAKALLSEYGWAPAIDRMGDVCGFAGWELVARTALAAAKAGDDA